MVPSPRNRIVGTLACAALALTLGACGARTSPGNTSPGTSVGDDAVAAVAEELREEGRVAYYLGPEADGNALSSLERVTGNGPSFQFWASYGTCSPEPGSDEGGCSDPITANTQDWQPDTTGIWCRRLEPQLGVPAGEIMGELTLFTERVQLSLVHLGDREGEGGGEGVTHALALLGGLRPVGDARAVSSLPAPDPDVAAWVDELCGTVPGQVVEHSLEDLPGQRDNSHVPGFTVARLGGGQLTWADHTGRPVAIAVGSLEQVSTAVRRLAPIVADSPSGATLLGLVVELDRLKTAPRSVAEVAREAAGLPAPVGYAAPDAGPAVWFMDSAANVGQVLDGMESGVIAFVDSTGEVRTYAPTTASDGSLRASTDALD